TTPAGVDRARSTSAATARDGLRSDSTGLTASARRNLWVLLVLGLAGFVALALGYAHDPLASLDANTAKWVAEKVPGWLEALAGPFSWLGGWIGITTLTVAAVVLLARERKWLDVGFVLVAVLGSQLAVALLKGWFDRPRPTAGAAVPLPSSASFPSGHATAGVASLGALTVLLAERLPSPRARTWLWSLVVVLGVAVGLSRIRLNVHYVTDVVARWCLGLPLLPR